MKRLFLYIIIVILVVSCGGKQAGSKYQGMILPESDKKAQLVEMATHFWDGIDLQDSMIMQQEQQFIPIFAQWADVVLTLYHEYGECKSIVPIERVKSNGKSLVWLMNIADECFRNPNSPYRCEELYIPMLEVALTADIDEVYKELYSERLATAKMNRQGSIATDFNYITIEGSAGTLHGIDSKYILLYFFNPDCHDCARVSDIIANDSTINNYARQGLLKVLALYPDKDMTAWNKHQGHTPKNWITARYSDITEREKYDLPAIPNLYLLDNDKIVLIKDATIEEIIAQLTEYNLLP